VNFSEPTAADVEQTALLEHFRQLDKFAWRMELLSRDESMVEHLFIEEQGEIIGPSINALKIPVQETEAEQDKADIEAASALEAEAEHAHEEHPTASVSAADTVTDKDIDTDDDIQTGASTKDELAKRHFYTVLSEMAERLEQHVGWVMSAMNRWCLTVLGWEIMLLALVAGAVAGIAAIAGDGQPLPVLQGWWNALLERPVSLMIYVLLTLLVGFLIHFRLRRHVAASIAARLDMVHPFDTQRAFLKNTRIWRSIFRPWPKGWASKADRKLNEIRKELAEHAEPGSSG